MNKLYLLTFVILLFVACKDEPAGDAATDTLTEQQNFTKGQAQNEPEKIVNPFVLPEPCTLVSSKELSNIFNVSESDINFKQGMAGQGQDFTKSCFITWEKDGERLGFLLQVMKNPLYGEFDGWATSYVNVLSENGEMSYPDNIAHKYESISGLGDAGVYNKDLGKVYWRYGDDMVVGLIFRDDSHKTGLKKTSLKLGKIIQDNLNN